jgi:multimeric flavodoxin WrbA
MDPRYVLILKGSPRDKGNSSILADRVAAGAKAAGAKVESFTLHDMDIKPCDACEACHNLDEGECVISDDMQILYPKLKDAAAIVVASPIYWFTMSAQTKLCIDRWYALETKHGHALTGKQFGFILTYGDSDAVTSGAINAIRTYEDMCRYIKASVAGMVYGQASAEGDVLKDQKLMEQAYRLGEMLATG